MQILQDARHSIRQLLKTPGFTVIAVLSLALGIGANTAIFGLVNALFLKSLPGARPNELVSVYTSDFSGPLYGLTSFPDFQELQQGNNTLAELFCYTPFPAVLTTGEQSDRIFGEFVSGNYFDALGLEPQAGRWFLAEEDRTSGTHPVAVLSDTLWQRRFHRDPQVVGKSINLNGSLFTVVGIATAGFNGMIRGFSGDLWVPTRSLPLLQRNSNDLTHRGSRSLFVMGRLKPNTPIEQVRANFNVLAAQLHSAHGTEWEDTRQQPRVLSVLPEFESRVFPLIRGPILGFMAFLMIVVGLILLIACSNLANLLLARSAARRREVAIRLSIGATRGRLVQQLLTENILLSLVAGAVGLVFASWTRNVIARFEPPVQIPLALDLNVDFKVLLFTMLASTVAGLLFGLFPALQSARADISAALKEDSIFRGPRRSRLKSTLITAQLALSLLLLIGSGLFLRSLQNANTIDPGFDPNNLLMLSVDLQSQGYEEPKGRDFYQKVTAALGNVPGVQSASLAEIIDLGLSNQRRDMIPEGYTPQPAEDMEVAFNRAGPGFLETMKIPVVLGRSLTPNDTQGTPDVVIVNQSYAERYWPGQQPLGKRVTTSGRSMEVVGIAKDAKYRTLGEEPRPFVYLPLYQHYQSSATFVVRTASGSAAVMPAIRAEIATFDKSLPVFDVKTGQQHMEFALLPARLAGSLLGALGVLALGLAAIGIYGVMSFAVAQRTREIGVRIALGAQQGSVLRLIVGEGMRLAMAGMAVGVLIAAAITRFASTFLYGISPTDPATFIGISGLPGLVAFLACYIPARRATRVDPIIALRAE